MKFSICNLGCKVNNYEANWYRQVLSQKYEEVPFGQKADIFIINSCTVTNTAGSKTRQMMHRARKLSPEAVIAVVGCYVQMEYQKEDIFADCDILVGSNHKLELPELIEQFLQTRERIVRVEEFSVCPFEEMMLESFAQTRAYLKIQDGCNQFCSYCVIPFARGRERSMNSDKVIETANKLVNSGHKELVLTGIHTGRYRYEDTDFTSLVKRLLNEVPGLRRLRISSIEVTELTDELLHLIAADERMAHHLHIPLQSGCDKTLKAMSRPYTTAEFKAFTDKVKDLIPGISISTDVIVGFPGETEEDFAETCEFIKAVGFSFLHVFPYAAKEHTVAAKLKNQVREEVKKARVGELTRLSGILYNEFINSFIGQTGYVLFENQREGCWQGHNSEYIEVRVEGTDLKDEIREVHFLKADEDILKGELV